MINRASPSLFQKWWAFWNTNDNWALASAATALSDAGIIFDIVAIDSVPANLRAPEPKWWTRSSRILVAKEDADEARSLVEVFQEPANIEDPEEDRFSK